MAPTLLQHTSTSVRAAAILFVSAAARHLSQADCYSFLLPLVLPALDSEPAGLEHPDAIAHQLAVPKRAAGSNGWNANGMQTAG